jgi:chemotaxis protein methyltransferase CheR
MSTAVESGHAERFRAAVASRLGLQFDDTRLPWLAEVLRRRADVQQQTAEAYVARLEHGPWRNELSALAQELTVAETYFFRNADQFRALREHVWPERLRAQATARRVRVLSAGCASGEEPYSIAMSLHDWLPDAGWRLSIRAVDLNPVSLDKARRARYSTWSLRETPSEQRQRWFRADGSEWLLDDTIRGCVAFEEGNLYQDDDQLWSAGAYDVVFCRNVLMYFSPIAARAVVARIARSLAPGGYLFLGHAETLRGLSQAFHLRHTQGAFYYQRKDEGEPLRAIEAADAAQGHTVPALAAAVAGAQSWVEVIGKAAQRVHTLAAQAGASVSRPVVQAGRQRARALELLREERYAEALDEVQGWSSGLAGDIEALLLQAVLLLHGGRLGEAEDLCHRLLVLDELNAGAHYVLALCREAASDPRGAAEHDEAAAYLDPEFAMPRLHLGLLARRAGDRQAQRREFERALALLQREDPSRLLLFGGGFGRDALLALCRAELHGCGGPA